MGPPYIFSGDQHALKEYVCNEAVSEKANAHRTVTTDKISKLDESGSLESHQDFEL